MQFFTGISIDTQSKSYTLSLTECVQGIQKQCIVGYSLTCLMFQLLQSKVKVTQIWANEKLGDLVDQILICFIKYPTRVSATIYRKRTRKKLLNRLKFMLMRRIFLQSQSSTKFCEWTCSTLEAQGQNKTTPLITKDSIKNHTQSTIPFIK